MLLCLLLISVCGAVQIDINNQTEKHYIIWTWENYTSPVNVYIDGLLIVENTSQQVFILDDLNTEEIHYIYLENLNITDTGEQYTSTEHDIFTYTTSFFFGLWVICLLISMRFPIFAIVGLIPAILFNIDLLKYSTDALVNVFAGLFIPLTLVIFGIEVKL